MSFFFFFDQYENDQAYFDTVFPEIDNQQKSRSEFDFIEYRNDDLLGFRDKHPNRLKITTRHEPELTDIRLLHDYISVVQILYSIFQSNDKYELAEQTYLARYLGLNRTYDSQQTLSFEDSIDSIHRNLKQDYELICGLADTENFLRINSGIKIETINKNSPLEIVFASSFFLLTLALILSGGRLKVDANSRTLEVNIPNLASGLKPLIDIFRKTKSEGDQEDQTTGTQSLFDEDERTEE